MSNYSDSSFDDSNKNTSWYKVFSRIPKKTTVLDVGCSSGNFGEVLIKQKGCTVDGVELDKKDALLATKKLRRVYTLNIETDNIDVLKNETYDVIYFGDVIEHLVDPVETLKRVKPLLREGGFIVFSIPNMAYIGIRLELLEGNFDYTETGILDKTHFHFYTQIEVERVFTEAGYHITEFDFVEKDYPRTLLKSHLKKIGLEAKEDFFKKMEKTEASAFQFVGVAEPVGKSTQVKRKTFGPIDLFENFHNDTVSGYEQKIKELNKSTEASKDEASRLRTELEFKQRHPYRTLAGYYKRKIARD